MDMAFDEIASPFRDTVKSTINTRKSEIVGQGSVYPSLQHGEGLSTMGGALAIVSTIVGGGIVGLPKAMLVLGLIVGISLNAVVCYITFLSGIVYLALRDLIPGKPNSLYEIGYMLQGRKSIFLVALIQTVNSAGLMLIYFIVFSSTAGQFVGGFVGYELNEIWYTSKWFYVVVLGVCMAPIVAKKELAELEWLSILLGVSILIFMILCIVLLLLPEFPATPPPHMSSWLYPSKDKPWACVSKICTVMVAYSY
jgi:amino acid permease